MTLPGSHIHVVEDVPPPEYPVPAHERLDSHSFLAWEFRRWLSSDMRWMGGHECKSMWFELVNLAHTETPVGTLPTDPERLARMIQPPVDVGHFKNLCRHDYGPLHGWEPCSVDGEVRLSHPVVTRIVQAALASRATHQARAEAASQTRRLKRLAEDVMPLHAGFAQSPDAVRFIDRVIQERVAQRGGQRRTDEDLHMAVSACVAAEREGCLTLPKQT